MDVNYKTGYPEVPLSITNKTVDKQFATDTSSPFTLLEFIKIVSSYTTHEDITSYYNHYILKWNGAKTQTQVNVDKQIVDAYTSFIKEISLNYTTSAEQLFLQNIDFTNPNDLDVALSFISRKIKEIALYYSKRREDIKLEGTRKKLKGSNKGVAASILEVVANFFQNRQSKEQTRQTIEGLEVAIEERYNTGSFFNKLPDDNNYNNKDRDYNLDIFLRSNSDLVAEAFSQSSETFKQVNEVSSIFDNKRELTKKYIGADFFYLSATPVIDNIPVINVNTEYTIAYNRQVLINQILNTRECFCIAVQAPATLTVLKCGATSYTTVSVVSGTHYDCVGDVFDIVPSSAVTKGNKCAQQVDCIPTTVLPISSTTSTTRRPPGPSPTTTRRPPVGGPPRSTTTTTKKPVVPPVPEPPPKPPVTPPKGKPTREECCNSVTRTPKVTDIFPMEADTACTPGYRINYEVTVCLPGCPDVPFVDLCASGSAGCQGPEKLPASGCTVLYGSKEVYCKDIPEDGIYELFGEANPFLHDETGAVLNNCYGSWSVDVNLGESPYRCCKDKEGPTTTTSTTSTTTTCPPDVTDPPGSSDPPTAPTSTTSTTSTTSSTTPEPQGGGGGTPVIEESTTTSTTSTTSTTTTTCKPGDEQTSGDLPVNQSSSGGVSETGGSGTVVEPAPTSSPAPSSSPAPTGTPMP